MARGKKNVHASEEERSLSDYGGLLVLCQGAGNKIEMMPCWVRIVP